MSCDGDVWRRMACGGERWTDRRRSGRGSREGTDDMSNTAVLIPTAD